MLLFFNYEPLLGFIFPFSWYIVRLQLINFTGINDDRKQERRRKSLSIHRCIAHYWKKAWHSARIDWQQFQTEKVSKSILGFKPNMPRQNSIALPLVPAPLHWYVPGYNFWPKGQEVPHVSNLNRSFFSRQHSIGCRMLKAPQGLLGGIGRRMSSLLWGGIASSTSPEAVSPASTEVAGIFQLQPIGRYWLSDTPGNFLCLIIAAFGGWGSICSWTFFRLPNLI